MGELAGEGQQPLEVGGRRSQALGGENLADEVEGFLEV